MIQHDMHSPDDQTRRRPSAVKTSTRDLLNRLLTELLPSDGSEFDCGNHTFRWKLGQYGGKLTPIPDAERTDSSDLHGLEEPIGIVRRNTDAFVRGQPANHVLLTGPRGCGKSTLARSVLSEFLGKGLRVIITDPVGLCAFDQIRRMVRQRSERFIVFCDDLSFTEFHETFRSLKVALEGGLPSGSSRLLVYATSNRRHLVPETFQDNLEASRDDSGELHHGETTEEKIALADRFGLWVPLFAPNEEEYLAITRHWLDKLGAPWDRNTGRDALLWSMEKGMRNGRSAYQFAVDRAQAKLSRKRNEFSAKRP